MRIIFLINKTFYLNKLCRARFLAVESFCNKYKHELIYTGSGWDNYNDNSLLKYNLEKFGKIDYIFCYKPKLYAGIQDIDIHKICLCVFYS